MAAGMRRIAFQGHRGAYSDLACRTVYPGLETVPCGTFEDAFRAARDGEADLAMIPVDNTLAGRVADVHALLPRSDLFIIGEHFLPIRHALLGVRGASIDEITDVHSHTHAIPQCRALIRERKWKAHVQSDTAGAAKLVRERADRTQAAIASPLAADIYDLDVLINDIQDADHNTTRFLILAREPIIPDYRPQSPEPVLTTLLFRVRNIPAALYKAMGGFATNGLNLAKLESYVDEHFQAARFYCDIEGHPEDPLFRLALQELSFFAAEVRHLGTYPAHPFRARAAAAAKEKEAAE